MICAFHYNKNTPTLSPCSGFQPMPSHLTWQPKFDHPVYEIAEASGDLLSAIFDSRDQQTVIDV